MAATFKPDLSDPVSRIRFDLGDTDVAAALLEDETITAMAARLGGDERRATLQLASGLMARFAMEPDKIELAEDEGSVTWGSRLKGWESLIRRLTAEISEAALRSSSGFRTVRALRVGRDDCTEYYGGGRRR
jgi:hypothetical protein